MNKGKETLTSIVSNRNVVECVDFYLATEETPPTSRAASCYPLYATRLSANRFVMPIAGVQGSGKSTLLNAIAFGRPVLPVEAEETTSVPVEIAWGSPPSDTARITFQDGREISIPATEEALSPLVDNRLNPGNAKGVKKVVLESDRDVFKHGLVLVDLPGVGSLTAANKETALGYLNEAVGVLYLLRTVPPITRSESIFVMSQWVRLPSMVFVQNRWTDESDDEVRSGLEHNRLILADLAKRIHIPLDGDAAIHVVNGYRALEGSLKNNREVVTSSGLRGFLDTLQATAHEWPEVVYNSIATVVTTSLRSVLEVISSQQDMMALDHKTLLEQMRDEQTRFDKYIEDIRSKRTGASEELDAFASKQRDLCGAWAKECRKSLRNKLRTTLKSGIVDGPRLERAILEEESIAADDVFADLLDALMELQDSLRERFKNVSEWKAERADGFHTVKSPESLKPEYLAPTVIGSGLGIGGTIAGAAFAGTKLGSALGLGGGPVGVAIGAAAGGLIGAFVGYWAGKQAQRTAINYRAGKIEDAVFKAIDQFVDETAAGLNKQIRDACDEFGASLDMWEREQVGRFEAEQKTAKNINEESLKERSKREARLYSDRELIKGVLAQLVERHEDGY